MTSSEQRPIRWGILGAGAIASKVAADIALTPGNIVSAVAARDADRAAGLAAQHDDARSYGDYRALVDDDDIDVVYVATTHPHHREQALLAIAAGKAVLVEKPTCLNAADAREVFDAARAADVFAMEAMWMRCNPLVLEAVRLAADGAIGQVTGVRAELGLGIAFDPSSRLYDLANGGGALLDLGIYPTTLAHLFLGPPDEVRTVGTLAPSGADDTVSMLWLYAGRPGAQLFASVSSATPGEAAIYGTQGWMTLGSPMYRPTSLVVRNADGERRIEDPLAGHGSGYGPQIEEVARCLRAALRDSALVPQAESVEVLDILDGARAALGVAYPGE